MEFIFAIYYEIKNVSVLVKNCVNFKKEITENTDVNPKNKFHKALRHEHDEFPHALHFSKNMLLRKKSTS